MKMKRKERKQKQLRKSQKKEAQREKHDAAEVTAQSLDFLEEEQDEGGERQGGETD